MSRKSKKKRAARRAHHNATAREDLPALILERDDFTGVKRAHIVPKMYQAAWAEKGKVTVHVLDEDGQESAVVQMPITHAGTRNRFYRRERPDGTYLDDTEASLAVVEAKAAPVLRHALRTDDPLALEDKGGLAQYVGVQIVRGPRFFDQRAELLAPLIASAPQHQFTSAAMRAVGGDLEKARARLRELYNAATQAHLTMLATAVKLGMVLGNMRWELLRFDDPVLAYSDHPVFVWPGLDALAEPQPSQSLGPLGAAEVLMPLGPRTLLLASWVDLPDPGPETTAAKFAAQANALTVGQAERQWMHQPAATCPRAMGPFPTMTSQRLGTYDEERIRGSVRRRFAAQELASNRGRTHLKTLRVLELAR